MRAVIFLPGLALLSFLLGCNRPDKDSVLVEKGYVLYFSISDRQKYFVKSLDGNNVKHNFNKNNIGPAFVFLSNNRLDSDLANIPNDTLLNIVNHEKLKKYLGKIKISPVKIFYQIDNNKAYTMPGIVDTFFINNNDSIKFVVKYPAVDVLKLSPVEK